MTFGTLLKNVHKYHGIASHNSKVKKSFVFVAIKGLKVDSHNLIDDAIQKGASLVVGEKAPADIVVPNSRIALSRLWSAWYGYPSKRLRVIGVSGTDGKTTTSNLIWWILKSSGKSTALVSTINAKIGNKNVDTGFHVTNPEPEDLQKYIRDMVDRKCKYLILEVTSHGIDQGRVAGIKFDTAVLTNVTHEHQDYHKNFSEYRKTKIKLFENIAFGVVNRDDPSWIYFKKAASEALIKTYSIDHRADYQAGSIRFNKGRAEFSVRNNRISHKLETNLLGEYNISNILAAISVARYYKCSWKSIKKAISSFEQLEGRLEKVANDKGRAIYVDFAHTPNALQNVLVLLKSQTKGRLIAVFGCAGERDILKRDLMPKIAVSIADLSIFTAEDPRSEDINDILKRMGKAVDKKFKHKFKAIPERGEAIFESIKIAKKGDSIVICGKGHEKSMAYNGIEYPWSDQEAVKMALAGKVMGINR